MGKPKPDPSPKQPKKIRTAPLPLQGPPGPGQWGVEYREGGSGTWERTLGGKNIPWSQPSKKQDFLKGLTHEAGTKSLLKGMLKFLK